MSMSSSSSSSNSKPLVLKAKRGSAGGLHGPRPQPLSLPTASSYSAAAAAARPSKKPRVSDGGEQGLVIIYERTPKAVYVRPDEFMAVVQRLTGQHQKPEPGHHLQAVILPQTETAAPAMMSLAEEETATAAADHLVLALRQQEAEAPLHENCLPGMPTPSPASDGFLLSPGIFLFSPATMQAIHEMVS